MIEVYPQLRDTKVEFVWGGTLDFAFDIMPHAGEIDGIYYALGYAGHGVAMATWQGQKMAELIAGNEIREVVRERYAAAARGARSGATCCGDDVGDSCGVFFLMVRLYP